MWRICGSFQTEQIRAQSANEASLAHLHKVLAPYKGLTKTGFTFEMSRHLPLWAQLNVDVEDEQLDQLISRRSK